MLVGTGSVLALLSFLGLPWVSGGEDLTFFEIRDRVLDAGELSGVSPAGRWYAGWIALTVLAVLALVTLIAAIGVRSRATIVFRTLGVVFGLSGVFVHYVGFWQLFDNDVSEAESAPFLVFLAYGLMAVGAVIGPRRPAVPPPWTPAMPAPGPLAHSPRLPGPGGPPPSAGGSVAPGRAVSQPGPSHGGWPPPRP